MRYDKPPLERYEIEDTGCWKWTGWKDHDGYGMARVNGKLRMAHRLFYESYVGQLDPALTIDHLCRKRDCVNPEHMEQVTQSVNAKRGRAANYSELCPQGHIKDKKILDRGYETMICSTCRRESQRAYEERKRHERKR